MMNSTTPEVTRIAEMAQMAREQAARVIRKVPLLGPVSWLLLSSPATRHILLSDLEWRVMPALVLDQAKLYLRDEMPVAFVSWARMSAPVAERYRRPPHQLVAADWKSGEQVWLVDMLAPFGGAQDVLKDLRENVFPGQPLHQLAPGDGALAQVLTLS